MRLRSLGRYLPVAATAAAFALVALAPDAALANGSGAGGGGGIQFTGVNQSIESAISLMTGPIMKLVAIIAILSGAFMLIQGRELGEGIKVFAILAVTIGLLIGAVNIMSQVGAGVLAFAPTVGLG
ncbi:MAG: hypothetical protein NVSMB14_16180 [Isosphaeraceae bacterium]